MAYKVVFGTKVGKILLKLHPTMQKRIGEALNDLECSSGEPARSARLHKPLKGYKRRVGKYRILFDIEEDNIIVRDIRKRDKAYI